MLSKIIEAKDVSKLELKEYSLPSAEDIDLIIEEKKREAKRKKIIEQNKDDPLKAAKKEANKILVESQEKLKDAQLEADALKTKQENEIRERLEEEYQTKLDTELKELKQNYLNSMETLAKLNEIIYKKSEKKLIELVFSISRKIIGDEIKNSPQIIMDMLQKGFEKIKDAKQFEIKIHPLDYEILSKNKESLQAILKTPGTIKFTGDESVERGGCKIITESGEISSEPGKQLDIIIKELEDGT